jgi:hypothetical protein
MTIVMPLVPAATRECALTANKRTPPKFAIATSFVIGSFSQEIELTNEDDKRNIRNINGNELIDLLKAMLTPVRPYGCVFAYSGGSQQSITGNYHFMRWTKTGMGQSLAI